MEKTILYYHLTVVGEEEEVSRQNHETWHRETLTVKTRSCEKNSREGGPTMMEIEAAAAVAVAAAARR
jgi:hypothetical protein